MTERPARRLLVKLRSMGDRAVIHTLPGRPSNQRFLAAIEEGAVAILPGPLYQSFGPTLAAKYLRKQHKLTVSKETLRQWMVKAGLWKAGRQRPIKVHQWRWRRSTLGESIEWDTSEHDYAATHSRETSPAGSALDLPRGIAFNLTRLLQTPRQNRTCRVCA